MPTVMDFINVGDFVSIKRRTIGVAKKACQAALPTALPRDSAARYKTFTTVDHTNSSWRLCHREVKKNAMDQERLKQLLQDVQAGQVNVTQALDQLRHLPFENLGFAHVDHHRALRQGFPEVIFGLGKTPEQIALIAGRLLERSANLLVTRTNKEVYEQVKALEPSATYHDTCHAITVRRDQTVYGRGVIAVVTAGTSDIPVADEAAITAELMGNQIERIFDVGVAGIHRVLSKRELLQAARVIVCAAGMEGALPSVVGGLVSVPVIAVPTSIGYGASFHGIAALLGMLNSCASNVTVVNIDNGFGAGFVASLINRE
jgi:pyridinium-3,5-biscarboxylic acid mononucleotide synthase